MQPGIRLPLAKTVTLPGASDTTVIKLVVRNARDAEIEVDAVVGSGIV
jgi:hypothetical protein